MQRLFTYGCSYTNYIWPTWADIIATNFEDYYNYGNPGAGNYYIAQKLYETHLKQIITKDDVVLIMLSSSNRFDVYNSTKRKFNFSGNIYNSEDYFGQKFVREVWNDSHSVYNTWLMVKSIRTLLDSIGCNYKIVEAFGLLTTDEGFKIDADDTIKLLIDDYKKSVYTKDTLQNFSTQHRPPSYTFTDTNPPNQLEGHPTIQCHHDFVKTHMSEWYQPQMETMTTKWENQIKPTLDEIRNTKFSSQKIKKKLF
jgi:hypothetical protein